MKRKNKLINKISPSEELEIIRRYCWEENQSFGAEGLYIMVEDALASEDCKMHAVDVTIGLHMDDPSYQISSEDVLVVSELDLSRDPDFVHLPHDDSAMYQVYKLKARVLRQELAQLKADFVAIKKCLSCSRYTPTLNLLPIEADPSNCSTKPKLHRTDFGDIFYWGPLNWYLITDIKHEDHHADVRDSMVYVPLKKGNEAKLAVFLGGDYESEVREDWDIIPPVEDFISWNTDWIKKKLSSLQKGIKANLKSML